jgi:adenine-specific DNA methylase
MSKQQAQLNTEIAAFVRDKVASGDVWHKDELDYVQQYTGAGGIEMEGATDTGVLSEFYTPDAIIQRMWALALEHGFTGGKILEPSAGTGRFLRYVDPANSTVRAFEMSDVSGHILKACFPWADVTIGEFETLFYPNGPGQKRVQPMADYDLVIGNPPYGARMGKYQGKTLEGNYTMARTIDQYFMEKGVQLLKQGGLLVFIIPSSFLNNDGSYNAFKDALEQRAELIDAYRMPLGIFDFTSVASDIVVLRKK